MNRLFLFFTLLFLSALCIAQPPYKEVFQRKYYDSEYPQKMPVLFRAYPVHLGDNQYRVYLPLEVQYRFMQFIRSANQFQAGGEVEFAFSSQSSNEIVRKIKTLQVTSNDFTETLSRDKYFTYIDSIDLPADRYRIAVKYNDVNGAQQISFSRNLNLKEAGDFYSPLPLLVSLRESDTTTFREVDGTPSPLMGHWNFDLDLGVYLQSWQADGASTLRIHAEVLNSDKGVSVMEVDSVIQSPGHDFALQFRVPREKLSEGRHRLHVMYYYQGDSTRHSLPFNVTWFKKPRSLWSLRLATGPLEYIVDKETLKDLNSGKDAERQAKLADFWREKDPTPDTPFNELQNEFYSRVDSTLAQFSSKRVAGWRTDRGQVYITQGVPDRIEDHSLDPVSNPFLRWIYILEDREVVYTFESLEGRKKYRLLDTTERGL